MKPSLQLKLGQSLTMTPQLQQAIRLLQLSSMELQTEIQDALESNMMLEMIEVPSEEQSAAETVKENITESTQDQSPVSELENIPEELAVDSTWEDTYESSGNVYINVDNSQFNFENKNYNVETLKEHLLWQLNLIHLSDTDKVIATTIIDALDDDGYLKSDLDELHASLVDEIKSQDTDKKNTEDSGVEIERDEIEAVLHMIQALEPTGVGARNPQECLLLQLHQCDKNTPMLNLAIELVSRHLDLLARRDFNQLMKKLKLKREKLQDIIALIQTMNPRPGGHIHEVRTEYITPDIYVKKINGRWRVELNPELSPNLRVNSRYASMIRRANNSEDNICLKSHLQEARWFIRSLQSRSETLLRVATCIVERQRAFLDYGAEAMRPMVLGDIAEALELHESTISRVTTRKYMHTPRGIFELKYFFSSHLSTSHGGEASSTAIRAFIKKLIISETPTKPLSDSKISLLLSEQGINVARRTVAKYREAMAIPPSNERKRLA